MRSVDPRGAAAPAVQAIAIGASAGGIDALILLLGKLPAATQASVFVVIHLPPSQPSLLPEIFGARCALRVVEAQDKAGVEPGTVYVAPPDYHLLVDAGPQLALSADPPVHFSRPAINVLFEAAADLYRQHLVGIILTGASHDGADGLAAVCRAGGLALVQDPDTAMVPTMPMSAIARCPQARVMALPEIARLLSDLCKETRA